jgi:prepilin-type N-terminal cleavage/methylation domain-containing protein
MPPRTRIAHAFTLIELLVVIAIITVLSGLILAGIGRVKGLSRKVHCASNLRQIGTAILAYASDFRGNYPDHNNQQVGSWPYGFGDWGTGAWGKRCSFYQDYLPEDRRVYFCPEGLPRQLSGMAGDVGEGWTWFPQKPPTVWIVSTNYTYFAGIDEYRGNARGGPRRVQDSMGMSTLISDLMRFGGTDYSLVNASWNHRGTDSMETSVRLNARSGGHMFHADGHVDWMSDPVELLRHRQKMKGNDGKSYCAVQYRDP